MFEKLNRRSLTVPLVVMATAFGLGGTALAASGTSNQPANAATQSISAASNTTTDVLTAGDKADSATDVPTAGDKADSASEQGSETVNDDGPSGHADEIPAQR